ncbi:MAG: TPM domain-containing protein [Steroidobacteraceae bacterium]|jgi:uncharacterized membrane protein
MVGRWTRILRHELQRLRPAHQLFTPAILADIEAEIGLAERGHSGEIRFVIETHLSIEALWHGLTPRARALQVFSALGVWDTAANNGVLIYLLLADRSIEIVADRGIAARVPQSEWEAVCRQIETQYAAGRYGEASCAAVRAVGRHLADHFPAEGTGANELPNQPVLL